MSIIKMNGVPGPISNCGVHFFSQQQTIPRHLQECLRTQLISDIIYLEIPQIKDSALQDCHSPTPTTATRARTHTFQKLAGRPHSYLCLWPTGCGLESLKIPSLDSINFLEWLIELRKARYSLYYSFITKIWEIWINSQMKRHTGQSPSEGAFILMELGVWEDGM